MLFGDGERPVRSRIDAVATTATYGLVLAVRDVGGKLWEAREDDIKAACAPEQIDEVDLLALVIADALGRPLLHFDDRNAVGKRVEACASRLWRVKLPEAKEKARKVAKKLSPEARAKAIADAEAALLAEEYGGLNLPSATVGRQERREREPPTAAEQLVTARAAWVVAEAEAEAATAAQRRVVSTLERLPADVSEEMRERYWARYDAAKARCVAAVKAGEVALEELHAAERAAAAAAASSDDASSVASEDYEWEWDETVSIAELLFVVEDMKLAVGLTSAGLVSCVDCARKLVHAARRSAAECAFDGYGPWYMVWR